MVKDKSLNATDRRILELLETGRSTPDILAEKLELERFRVSRRLRELVDRGLARKVDPGLYDLAAGERVHLSTELAERINECKGTGTSHEEYIKRVLQAQEEFPEVSEWDKTPDTVHADDPPTTEKKRPKTDEPAVGDEPETPNEELKPHERNYTTAGGVSLGGLLDGEFTQLYDVVPGEGEVHRRRIETVVEMYKLLQREGSAEKADFVEVVHLDLVEYSSFDLAWSNMVEGQDTLSALPCVEKPPKGQATWTYNY